MITQRWQIWLSNKRALENDFQNFKEREVIKEIGTAGRVSLT